MEKLRKIIKNALYEAFGVVFEIDKAADWVAETFIKNILYQKENNPKLLESPFRMEMSLENGWTDKLLINKVYIRTNINDTFDKVLGGSFIPEDTKRYLFGNREVFDVYINLNLNWDYKTDIQKQLSAFFSHELHHAYDHVVRIDKKSKTKAFNLTKNMIKGIPNNITKNNPALKDFMEHFYLVIPEEINARVQEAYNIIKDHKDKEVGEIMKILHQTKPMKDVAKMLAYKSNNVLSLSEDTLKTFIAMFKESMETSLIMRGFKEDDFKFPTQPKQFFEFWRKRINREGMYLFQKMLKMVKESKKLTNEKLILVHMDTKMIVEIFGYDFLNSYGNEWPDYF